ncbi:C40 family peptidase [Clostridium estertheticum]|uniref:C40 family peptidase n=1 Tax=Clostridium estertheticum TaxID=238834 RepID=UPI001C0B64B7|nr:SH3 domain-containing protein [Clostridium estertheticum]MBU3075665.1 SH3 domain-containing protein [Clostridium estertheticum]MBU3165777.1 SH3 domain-containing protein [Clostridium estertheticum]MBU3173430.1 SH3 domain-containing protein [Clostridium estertheticum]
MKKRIVFIVMLLSIVSSQIAIADTGVVNTSSLRVRQKPSLLSNITGYLSKNEKITTLGKSGDFYIINQGGKTGYIGSSYVNLVKSAPVTTEKHGQITATTLNVRSGAGSTYPVTGSITLGSKVTILGTLNGFYKIIYNGKTNYISTLYVKVTSSTSTPTPAVTPIVTTPAKPTGVGKIIASDFLNVRKTASLDSKATIIGSLKPNQKIDIYGTQGNFYKIKYSGQWGYIYKPYVSMVNETSNSPNYIANGQQSTTTVTGNNIVSYANTFLGTPYLWGGTTPATLSTTGKYISGGFDCSGLVLYVYNHYGITLPRTTMDQINVGTPINIDNLKNGDLVFFTTNTSSPSEVSHIGIYIGNNKFIHCPKPGDVVKISELTGYYKEHFVIGKRVIK